MAHGRDNLLELPRDASGKVARPGEAAFDAFARTEQGHLLRYFRRHLPNDEDAQDAAQESMARLLRYRGREPADAWRPLLFRIASNVVAEFFRRGAVRGLNGQVSLNDYELVSDAPSQEELLEQSQREALLRTAIVALPARCRQVYLLSRVDGLTYPQIAKHCDISIKTVEKHIVHALALLQQQVGAAAGGAS